MKIIKIETAIPEHVMPGLLALRIHTDEGAREAGFSAALVAGVTSYAYLTHPVVEAWGVDWLRHGGGEVRFRSPVISGDLLTCTPAADDEGLRVTLTAPRAEPPLALLRAWRDAPTSSMQASVAR